MGVSGQRDAPAALYPRGKDPGTHCTGDWVGPRAGLDTEDRGKILCPCRGSNPDRPVVLPVVRHYTAWANPAPLKAQWLLYVPAALHAVTVHLSVSCDVWIYSDYFCKERQKRVSEKTAYVQKWTIWEIGCPYQHLKDWTVLDSFLHQCIHICCNTGISSSYVGGLLLYKKN
jgi:hypothetical protein